ncbi:MAG: LysR substrate-binding domain-containing protein [Labrys sp. (in: a-proteobacteria)]|jgi:DNA-binding transcriptional LysR family regulator
MVHSSPTLPPLDTLETFTLTARKGSFSATARTLGITHGAVSRQIGRLERWLGGPVFERAARGVVLTPDGQRFLARAEAALDMLGGAENRWVPRQSAGTVRISVTTSFAALWLFPRLASIERDDVRVDIVIEHRLADFADGIDLAVRCGRGPWDGVIAALLWREEARPIASPAVARALRGNHASDLLAMPLLHDSTIAGWRDWMATDGIDYRPRPSDRRFEDYNLVLDACAAGLGLALARSGLADARLRDGTLVTVADRAIENPVAFHLIRPDAMLRRPAVLAAERLLAAAACDDRTAIDFLAGRVQSRSADGSPLAGHVRDTGLAGGGMRRHTGSIAEQ